MAGHHTHHYHDQHYGHSFLIGIVLNATFIVAELFYGFASNSLALVADAAHNVGDVMGLFLAWGALWLSKRKPTSRYTYGLQSSSILAALANAMLLMIAVGGILVESWQRFLHPQPVQSMVVIWVALLGVLINGASAWMFMAGRKNDLNIQGAFLHMVADALVSMGVVIGGIILLYTNIIWIDAAISLMIAAAIVITTWKLLKDSVKLALHAVPEHINALEVKAYLASLAGVEDVHDLHIWATSTSQVALSAHLLMPGGHPGDTFFNELINALDERFKIGHATIQVEMGDAGKECGFAHDHAI